jgi:hypothetical protein
MAMFKVILSTSRLRKAFLTTLLQHSWIQYSEMEFCRTVTLQLPLPVYAIVLRPTADPVMGTPAFRHQKLHTQILL